MSNQLKKTVDVYYKEGVIAQIESGKYAVINCKGDELEDNLIVKVPEDMTPVMFKDITGTVTVNGYVELLAEDGTAAKRVYLNIQVPSEYMLQGTYDSGNEYKIGDIVVHRGEVFVKIGEGQTEPVNGDVWQLFGGAIQDEKEVDIITYGKIEFEPDEGYVAIRKLIANVANVTTDATAIEEDVVYGKTFWAGGESKAGTMKMVDSSTFKSLVLEKIAEGELEIQYYADKNAYILNNKGQTRPGTIGTILEPKFIADNIASGVTLFGLEGKHAPIFDGTINIESGFTTISGSYLIDESKAYDLLQTYGKVKTFNVNFSAGGSGKDMGDSRNFTSMTFDGTYGFIKYNDKAAFAMNGGFAEYNNNYGDGNGARVQFEEGTECRKEFKELFLSIADEYVEPEVTDELAGTWVLNDVLDIEDFSENTYDVSFVSNSIEYGKLWIGFYFDAELDYLLYSSANASWGDGVEVYRDTSWLNNSYKTITITSKLSEVTNGSTLLAWLKANATKQGSKPLISFTIGGKTYQAESGMTWGEWVASDYNTSTYALSGSIVYDGHGSWVQLNGQSCSGTDFIIDGATYVHVYASGSN